MAWYYIAAGTALAFGGTLGGVLAAGLIRSPGLQTAVVLAHAHLNLLGWLGLAIIGTQFMLWPMVLRTRMSQDAPRAARRVFAVTACGLAVTTVGAARRSLARRRALAGRRRDGLLRRGCRVLADARRPGDAGQAPASAAAWALLAGNAWLLAALIIDTTGLAAGLGEADHLLARLLIPVLGVGVIAQALAGALTFLLPVTVGGGPAGNRRLTAILEYAWRSRAALGNAGVLALAVLPAGGWRIAAWAAVLAGFGTFPVLAAAALAAARRAPARSPG